MSIHKVISAASLSLLFGALFSGQPAIAQPDVGLQEQIDALRQEIQKLKNKDKITTDDGSDESEAKFEVEAAGAPKFSGDGFRNFKIRGRIQADAGQVSGANRLGDSGLGTTTEFRRVRIGAQGDIGEFGYVFEVDFANNGVSVEDGFFYWKGKPLTVIMGHHKPWVSLEEQADDLFVPFMERAAFTTAFQLGFGLGVSAIKGGENYSLRAGVLSTAGITGDDTASGYIPSARINYGPEFGGGRLHLAASILYREDPQSDGAVTYSRKPQINTTDTSLVSTGDIPTNSDTLLGLEAGTFRGPFYAIAEWGFLHVNTAAPLVQNANFHGGYLSAGYVLTGETYPYDPASGSIGRLGPDVPLGKGGIGAFVANVRFDYLDLSDQGAGIDGGRQSAYMLGLTWIPNDYVRFLANYSHVAINGGPFAAIANPNDPADRSYSVDVFGIRAQIDW